MCRLFSTFCNNKLNGYSLYIIKSFTNVVEEVCERVLFNSVVFVHVTKLKSNNCSIVSDLVLYEKMWIEDDNNLIIFTVKKM